MLYHVEFNVEYGSDMSQQDLFKIWSEEAKVALARLPQLDLQSAEFRGR